MQRTPGCRTCVPAEVPDGLLETHAWNEWMISRALLSPLAVLAFMCFPRLHQLHPLGLVVGTLQ